MDGKNDSLKLEFEEIPEQRERERIKGRLPGHSSSPCRNLPSVKGFRCRGILRGKYAIASLPDLEIA